MHTDVQSTTTLLGWGSSLIFGCSAENVVTATSGGGSSTSPPADSVRFPSTSNQLGNAHASWMTAMLATNRKTIRFHVMWFGCENWNGKREQRRRLRVVELGVRGTHWHIKIWSERGWDQKLQQTRVGQDYAKKLILRRSTGRMRSISVGQGKYVKGLGHIVGHKNTTTLQW